MGNMAIETTQTKNTVDPDMLALLHAAADRGASDVHLVPGYPVSYRVHGRLEADDEVALTEEDIRRMVESILPESVRGRLAEHKSYDCSVAVEHQGVPCRFRANVYLAQERWCACLRHVANDIPSFEWMGFPAGLAERLVGYHNGLVIITGVTGSGKSTTLAALIDLLNRRGGSRIITVEEPIEYVHKAGRDEHHHAARGRA